MNFKSFAEFTEHYRLSMQAFHGQLMEADLSDEDRACYRRMVAALAVEWLVRSGDVEALAELRELIGKALKDNQPQRRMING